MTDSGLVPGARIGNFVIRARLGEGGMGVVVAAHDSQLDRAVALKLLKPGVEHPGYRARLLREAQAMARLEHPNVLRVYEIGSDGDRLYVAMELVDGVTLGAWLRAGPRTWREIVAMFLQVGAGLAAVHRAGLIHRDFKPDNVLIDRSGRARVADFGLARLGLDPNATTASPELAASLTRTGVALGTPGYMAPEQQFGGEVDARADQYSYAVALLKALVGDQGWGEVPEAVRQVVLRGTAFERDDRFPSMDALLIALASAVGQRRRRWIAVAGVALALGSGGVTFAALHGGDDAAPAPAPGPTVVEAAPAPAPAPTPVAVGSNAAPRDAAAEVARGSNAAPRDAAAEVARGSADPAPGRAVEAVATTMPRGSAHTATPPPARTPSPRRVTPTASTPPEAAKRPAAAASTHASGSAAPRSAPRDKPHELAAARRSLVAATIAELGYGGLTITGDDREADLRDLRAKLAAETAPLNRGGILYAIGAAERKRVSCGAAAAAWRDARPELVAEIDAEHPHAEDVKRRDLAFLFLGRISVARGLCELEAGHALAAESLILDGIRSSWAAQATERTEMRFALAIVTCETRDRGACQRSLSSVWYASRGDLKQRVERYGNSLAP